MRYFPFFSTVLTPLFVVFFIRDSSDRPSGTLAVRRTAASRNHLNSTCQRRESIHPTLACQPVFITTLHNLRPPAMSTSSRPKRHPKSLSATPPLPNDNANTSHQSVNNNTDDSEPAATTTGPPSTSSSPSTPIDEPKPDVDPTMPSDAQPKPAPPVSSAKKPPAAAPQLISHLPRAEKEAMSVFTEIECNHYQYSTLGLSRELLESMTCDCQYDPGQSRNSSRSSHTLVVHSSFSSFSLAPRGSFSQSWFSHSGK